MGHGIAQVAAMAGWRVSLYDVAQDQVERGRTRIAENLDGGVARGKLGQEERDACVERIAGSTVLGEAVSSADLVIEAIPEVMGLKLETFRQVEAAAPGRALLATNTSSLSVGAIAGALADPSRLAGMHFFNPVHIMKLVEIVRHEAVTDPVVATLRQVAERMRKTAIVVNDAPGFASSRLGLVLGLEAIRMVEAGVASAADIDTAMKLGYGHPMGPLELTDHVGLDVRLSIARYLADEIGPAFSAPPLLERMVDDGKLGKKSGQGFYRWQAGKRVDATKD